LTIDSNDYLITGAITNTYSTFQDFIDVVNSLLITSGVQLASSSNNDFYVVGSDGNPITQTLIFDFYDDTAGAWFTKTWLPDTIQIQIDGSCKLVEIPQSWNLLGNSNIDENINFIGTIDNKPVIIKTSNIQRVIVMNDGNIGIGLNNPNTDLHLQKSENGEVAIVSENTSSLVSAYSEIVAINGNVRAAVGAYKAGNLAYFGTDSVHPIYFQTNNTRRVLLTSTGNVGIGLYDEGAANVPRSLFESQGSFGANIRSVNTSLTLLDTDYTVVFTAASLTATLPASVNRRIYNIKNVSTGNLSITGSIDGVTQTIVIGAGNSRTFHGNGTTWYII
jgi:hypothetical protein